MPGIINSRQWLKQRRQHLEDELKRDLPDDQRAAVEAELAKVQAEAARSAPHWWRWILGGKPPA